ncbi:hypothetical protein [Metamycoplasma hyosynoviae]|uniref:hypothetical protein n=1 Tax=Metamycoplasma hyosynoviae TaxID=29559 RepID=UPI00236234D7|nr:hypothetical protein [Metamycoplasma hyosynoviae]MDD1359021.1 hypothetical protein [Metamycoplasma hyosynoviae]
MIVKKISREADAIATAGIYENIPKTELNKPWTDLTIFIVLFNPADWIENTNWLIEPKVLISPLIPFIPLAHLFKISVFWAL